MNHLSYRTVSANKATAQHNWLLVDAEGKTVGRLSSQIAAWLRGKHKTNFTPHVDCGDYVVVINADKIYFSGKKWEQKEYITYSGYPGGQKRTPAMDVLRRKPNYIIESAIKGMLPKNRLGRAMFRKLFIYTGTDHPHTAQNPQKIEA